MKDFSLSSYRKADSSSEQGLGGRVGTIFREMGVEGCFLSKSHPSGEMFLWNEDRARKRYRPASTFKIFTALLSLELGLIDLEERIPWDGSATWSDQQRATLDIATAFRVSAVWFFRILARRIGVSNFGKYLSIGEYGNADCGGTVESFWLRGPLEISPFEQFHFLEQLRSGNLPFSQNTISQVLEMMVLEGVGETLLRGKTGWIDETENYGWFVGYQEIGGIWRSFVTQMDIPNQSHLEKRRILALRCLEATLS